MDKRKVLYSIYIINFRFLSFKTSLHADIQAEINSITLVYAPNATNQRWLCITIEFNRKGHSNM